MRRILTLLALLFATPAFALDFVSDPQMAQPFGTIPGTFVLYDVSAQRLVGHNSQRAATQFSPASTFKIPNSLIGLKTGAVSSVDEVFFHYDGTPMYLKSWERDMSLRDAIKVSNVAAYQTLARRIGLPAMQSNVTQLHYGNGDIGQVVDTFWLSGPLKISAIEQTEFLARLAQGKLPYPATMQAAVRDISRLDAGKDWVLYGKTGWTGKQQPSTGWFVGWVEQSGKVYSFALNMDIKSEADLPKRIEFAKTNLRSYGLLK